jgi:hypothetical protein
MGWKFEMAGRVGSGRVTMPDPRHTIQGRDLEACSTTLLREEAEAAEWLIRRGWSVPREKLTAIRAEIERRERMTGT